MYIVRPVLPTSGACLKSSISSPLLRPFLLAKIFVRWSRSLRHRRSFAGWRGRVPSPRFRFDSADRLLRNSSRFSGYIRAECKDLPGCRKRFGESPDDILRGEIDDISIRLQWVQSVKYVQLVRLVRTHPETSSVPNA